MEVLSTSGKIMKRYKGQYVVAVAVRDDNMVAYRFSVVRAYDNMDDAVAKCDSLCVKGIDSVVIPCFTDKEFETKLSQTEAAYVFRRMFDRHDNAKDADTTVSFNEAIAIFCEIILNN